MNDLTCDAFLGGKLKILQPKKGFRAGLDAVLLAACVPARSGDQVVELGAGCGTASLCLASRVAGCTVIGVEIDAAMTTLADANAQSNKLSDRVSFVVADALARGSQGAFDHVFSNPPFHPKSGRSSALESRAKAKHDLHGLGGWIVAGLRRAKQNGTLTIIVRADRLTEILTAASGHAATVFPLWPHADGAAKRVVVRLRKDSNNALRILPGLILHTPEGTYTDHADAILRGNASLDLDSA